MTDFCRTFGLWLPNWSEWTHSLSISVYLSLSLSAASQVLGERRRTSAAAAQLFAQCLACSSIHEYQQSISRDLRILTERVDFARAYVLNCRIRDFADANTHTHTNSQILANTLSSSQRVQCATSSCLGSRVCVQFAHATSLVA